MSIRETPKNLLMVLHKKFNIIDHLAFLDFDKNYNALKDRLAAVKKFEYDSKDKILVEHFDTDFYFPEMPVGIAMKNFFTVAEMVDIPLHIFIFYTNHFGISKEVDLLCQNKHHSNRPVVLESFVSKLHYPTSGFAESDANFNAVNCHALALIHGKRSHRHALYNHICHIDKDHLAVNFILSS